MKKWFYIKVPVYDTVLFISNCQSDEEFKKSMTKHYDCTNFTQFGLHSQGRIAGTICDAFGDPMGIRLSKNPKTTIEGKAQLNHELFHTVSRLLKTRGFRLTNSSEEAYAYLQSFLTEQIYKGL
jgi:hypothetical protein